MLPRMLYFWLICYCQVLITYGQVSPDYSLIISKGEALLKQSFDLKDFAGATCGVLVNDSIIWVGTEGFNNIEKNVKTNRETLFRTASIAKPMTAIAILQLVEKGKLDLDVPIQQYLPEFPEKQEGVITVRHLLNHTSGIKAYPNRKEAFPKTHYPTLIDAIAVFKDRELLGVPGEVYRYSTYNYVVLGAILEKVSGLKYGDYMKKYVWEPSGMFNTGVEEYSKQYPNKATLYKKNKQDEFVLETKTDLSLKIPGGGLYSTTPDILRFGQAILNHKLIQKETFAMIIEDPKIKKHGTPYGMGWFLYAKKDGKYGRVIGHGGSQTGTGTQLMILLDQGVVTAGMANTTGSNGYIDLLTRKLYEAAVDSDIAEHSIKKVVSVDKKILKKYEGKYDFGNNLVLTIRSKGNLLEGQATKQPALLIYPEGENKFFYRVMDAGMEFVKNEQTQKYDMVYYQNGKTYYPKRLK